MFVAVFDRAGLDESEALLTGEERRCLDHARFGPRRRAEWIAGRVAVRRSLSSWLGEGAEPVSVVSAPSGAPRALGRPDLSISLTHDGAWVAVAATHGAGRAAVDLCDGRYGERIGRLLDRLVVDGDGARLSPCAAWAALECTLKLRGLGIASLLDARLVVSRVEPRVAQVSGLGASASVSLAETEDFALAWAEEP
jgi:hypothetical protein